MSVARRTGQTPKASLPAMSRPTNTQIKAALADLFAKIMHFHPAMLGSYLRQHGGTGELPTSQEIIALMGDARFVLDGENIVVRFPPSPSPASPTNDEAELKGALGRSLQFMFDCPQEGMAIDADLFARFLAHEKSTVKPPTFQRLAGILGGTNYGPYKWVVEGQRLVLRY